MRAWRIGTTPRKARGKDWTRLSVFNCIPLSLVNLDTPSSPEKPWTLEISRERLLCYDQSQQRSGHGNWPQKRFSVIFSRLIGFSLWSCDNIPEIFLVLFGLWRCWPACSSICSHPTKQPKLIRSLRFSKTHEYWSSKLRFSLPSIILTDPLGNKTLL